MAKPASKKSAVNTSIVKFSANKAPKKSSVSGCLSFLFAIAILFSATGLIVGLGWLGFMYIFQPHQVTWINQLLPNWAQVPWQGERPKSLTDINSELQKQGEIAGKFIPLAEDKGRYLLPIYTQRPNCSSDCREITELRLYEVSNDAEFESQQQKYYYLLSQTSITGPEESFVLAPLANATNEHPGSSINLPLTEIDRFSPRSAPPGFWFYLHGSRADGIHHLTYGQIFFYNPERDRLQQMLVWTSPQGQIPQWQEITGGGMQELLINQSVGLEPQFRVFQVKTAKSSVYPTSLEEILLQPPAWNDKAFTNALQVARSGLWSPADKWLQFIQKQKKSKIPARAQAQIALVRLHAEQTTIQADADWASPGQAVLANLIDGRWGNALRILQNSGTNVSEISRLLKADGGRLGDRVRIALGINPKRSEVQIWGALIIAAQTNEKRANAWLQSQPHVTEQTRKEVQIWLQRLRGG
ncbi:hypothetical protein [Calothrix sp. NIES-3974]|uniref:hypothetical protein n=1 Tax=Calothrix sp. NIES-3974 TaxID=2005462 RepID=UPI000B5E667C|nr:hypothetical protein [Calothrix sp. NIES-3974]BAZ04902.1 hypothetical protein NIES3974_15480 [Calothrix sp. NIES-3974]